MTEPMTYHREGDYMIPDLKPLPLSDQVRKWANAYIEYMEKEKYPIMIMLKMNGELLPRAINRQISAELMEEQLKKQLMEQYGVNNQLRNSNQMEWVRLMKQIEMEIENTIMKEVICK